MEPLTWLAIFLITTILSAGITYALTPKPKLSNAKPASVNDLEIPQPPTDEPIPIIYGTVQTQLYILHHGGFKYDRVTEGSEDFIIGYRYYLDCVFGISDQCGELVEVRISNKHLKEYMGTTVEKNTTGEVCGAQHFHIDPLRLDTYPRQGYWRDIYSNLGFWRALDAIYDEDVDGYEKYPYEHYFAAPFWSSSGTAYEGEAQYHGMGGYFPVNNATSLLSWANTKTTFKVFTSANTKDSYTVSLTSGLGGAGTGVFNSYCLNSNKAQDRYIAVTDVDAGTLTRRVYNETFTGVQLQMAGTASAPVYYFALPITFSLADEGVTGKIKLVSQSNRLCYIRGMRVAISGGVKYVYMHLYDDPGYVNRTTGLSVASGQTVEVYWVKCGREVAPESLFEPVTTTKYVMGVNAPLVPTGYNKTYGGYITSFVYYKYVAVSGSLPTVDSFTRKLWMGTVGATGNTAGDIYLVLDIVTKYLGSGTYEIITPVWCYNYVPDNGVGNDGDYAIDPFRKVVMVKNNGVWCHDEPSYDVAGMSMPDVRLFIGSVPENPVVGALYIHIIPYVYTTSWTEMAEARLTSYPATGKGNALVAPSGASFLTDVYGLLSNADSRTMYDGGVQYNHIGAKFLFKPSLSSVTYPVGTDQVTDVIDHYMYESTGIPSTYNDMSVVFGRNVFLGIGPTLPNFTFVVCNIPNITIMNDALRTAWATADIKPEYFDGTDINFTDNPYLCSCIAALPPKSYFFNKDSTSATSSAGITVREHKIQKDVNPAVILLDLLIRHAKTPVELIDVDSFASAAIRLYQEYTGMSLIILTQTSISDIITLILEHIDGFLFTDPRTGKLKLTLARARTNDETNQTALTCADIGDIVITRQNISSCATKLNVKYFDGYPSVAFEDPTKVVSMGSFQTKVDSIVFNPMDSKFTIENEVTIDRTGFSNRSTLYRNLKRSIKKYTYPYATIKFTMDLARFDKELGDVIRVNLPSYELNDQYYRITEIDFRDDKSTTVQVTAIEDIYDTSDANFLVDDSSIAVKYVDTSVFSYAAYTVPLIPALRPELPTYTQNSFNIYALCLVSWLPIHTNGVVTVGDTVMSGGNTLTCVPSGSVALTGTGAYLNTWTYFDSLRVTSMPVVKYGVPTEAENANDPLYVLSNTDDTNEKLAVLVYETTSGDKFYEYVSYEDITEVSTGVYDVTGVLRGAYNSPQYINDRTTDGTISHISMFFVLNNEIWNSGGIRSYESYSQIISRTYTSLPTTFDTPTFKADVVSEVQCDVVDNDGIIEWARPGAISEFTLKFVTDSISGYVNGILTTIYRYKIRMRVPCISKGYVQPLTDTEQLQGVTEDFRRRSEKDSVSVGVSGYLDGALGQYSYSRRVGSYMSGTAYEFMVIELILSYTSNEEFHDVISGATFTMSHNTMSTTAYGSSLSDTISFDLSEVDTSQNYYIFLQNGRLYCKSAYLDDDMNLTAFSDFEGQEITAS